jgi:hypothetical protein
MKQPVDIPDDRLRGGNSRIPMRAGDVVLC